MLSIFDINIYDQLLSTPDNSSICILGSPVKLGNELWSFLSAQLFAHWSIKRDQQHPVHPVFAMLCCLRLAMFST